ncbi:MAG: UDP-N-acetylmuramate dehydrogenase [Chitinophagales bacterium]|nr:UDP-N-acetylmuramate dehydrogenase [Chitinophagales bacterium]
MQVLQNVSLKPYNTFGIDVRATYLTEVFTIEELRQIILNNEWERVPKLILGGGSNILFTKDFEGLVILNRMKGIQVREETDKHVWLRIMGGEVWHELVVYAIQHGWGGIENLSLIPGLVGAAPMQNIGAYGVELEKVFDSLEAVDMETADIKTFSKAECAFGYRESVFKKELKGRYFILSVTLRLDKQPVLNTSYGDIKQTLADMRVHEPNIHSVSEAVIKIRSSKLPNPAEIGNAGSFFKNPEISKEQFESLVAQYPVMPSYPLPNGNLKIPAGWLIEQCGWKGKQVGHTGSHAKQALVLVNYGGASGNEVKALADDIRQSVQDRFGIDIVPEVNIV